MSTNPTVPAPFVPAFAPGDGLTDLTGALRTTLGVLSSDGDTVAGYIVLNGVDADCHRWTRKTYPATAEGEREARARFAALVDAARTVQA